MAQLIIPNRFVEIPDTPHIFLAGPIRSAPNWQDEAVNYLFSKNSNLVIISPRRGIRPEISKFIVEGGETKFTRQRAWERYYLDIAVKNGAIMFWLPGEAEYNRHKVYGAMTRFELGQFTTMAKYNPSIKICIGNDGNFPEMHTIEYDLQVDLPQMQIHSNLEETCQETLKII
jgi:hypothetical protein